MADTSNDLLAILSAGLAGLPQESVRRALEYYEDYIVEALEAGRSREEIMRRLGPMEEIVAHVRAESSLNRAESSPGPLSLTGAARQTFRGLAGGAARVSLVVGATLPYALAMMLYLTAVVVLLGAFAVAALLAYEIATMPVVYLRERIGTAGLAALGASSLVATGLAFWLVANGINRVTLRALRRGLRRGAPKDRPSEPAKPRKRRTRITLLFCAAAALIGAVLTAFSGLPEKYFTIWNSGRPDDIVLRTWSYDPKTVEAIVVVAMNSRVSIEAGDADAIRIAYEEPPWLTGGVIANDGSLTFQETSRGMLPLLSFVARHEGMTSVRIEVPPRYLPRTITVTTIGGHVYLATPARDIRVQTITGGIRLAALGEAFHIKAFAPDRNIFIHDSRGAGKEYETGPATGSPVELRSDGGMIELP